MLLSKLLLLFVGLCIFVWIDEHKVSSLIINDIHIGKFVGDVSDLTKDLLAIVLVVLLEITTDQKLSLISEYINWEVVPSAVNDVVFPVCSYGFLFTLLIYLLVALIYIIITIITRLLPVCVLIITTPFTSFIQGLKFLRNEYNEYQLYELKDDSLSTDLPVIEGIPDPEWGFQISPKIDKASVGLAAAGFFQLVNEIDPVQRYKKPFYKHKEHVATTSPVGTDKKVDDVQDYITSVKMRRWLHLGRRYWTRYMPLDSPAYDIFPAIYEPLYEEERAIMDERFADLKAKADNILADISKTEKELQICQKLKIYLNLPGVEDLSQFARN